MEIFRAQNAGHLVTISSMSAMRGLPKHLTVYAATKAACEALVKSWANETENLPLRVNSVNPGATRTAMREKAYPGEDPQTVKPPEEVASRIAELFEGDFETGHRERVG